MKRQEAGQNISIGVTENIYQLLFKKIIIEKTSHQLTASVYVGREIILLILIVLKVLGKNNDFVNHNK